ncbi:MAG: multicopper oxidase domain-containing protein [Spirochaetales bacterium]|nr:multicopper oxidase domain-containing protein [Spirochaetales bacterium]
MKRIILILVLIILGADCTFTEGTSEIKPGSPLPIPPILSGMNLNLQIQEGSLELPFGTSASYGFNGDYLGPTIRVRKDDYITMQIENTLSESTTVHWHGLHVPAEFDGGPHQIIKAGQVWKPKFQIAQNAATLWYHPHLMGKTAEHVYRGLAGMFIIDDDYSDSLSLPDEYGVNDIPLIIQDREFDRNGSFTYGPSHADLMQGYIGNAVLVNGAFKPELELSRGTYRFRILNGSNSSIYRLTFSDSRQFTVIAGDGGFLPKSVGVENLILSPGERFEILMDFKTSEIIKLNLEIYGSTGHEIMTMKIVGNNGRYFEHPANFLYEPANFESLDLKKRSFIMETRGMGIFTINGARMDMNVINFTMDKNSNEIWTIRNQGMGMMNIPHSFHVHDTQFKVLSFNGRLPGPLYSGPKDTILVMPGDVAVIGVSFKDYTGIYMYHCHLLEHEDTGMMGQFKIE